MSHVFEHSFASSYSMKRIFFQFSLCVITLIATRSSGADGGGGFSTLNGLVPPKNPTSLPWQHVAATSGHSSSGAAQTSSLLYEPDPTGTGTISYSSVADNPDAGDGMLRRLAESLGNDPLRMYEWVRNNIRTEFYPGASRGAYTSYVDRAGNDIDQCALLGALFRAAGVTPKYYLDWVFVPRTASGANTVSAYDWLGVTDDESAVRVASAHGTAEFDSEGRLVVGQMWISAILPGRGETLFFPSIKPHQIGRRPNVDEISEYTWNDAAIASGSGSSGSYSVALDVPSLRTYLTGRALAASSTIRNSSALHDISGTELARVRAIVPEVVTITAPAATRYPANVLRWTAAEMLTGIPVSYCSWVRVMVGTTETWFEAPALLGWPLAVEFDGLGVGILRHNGVEVARDTTGNVGASVSIELTYEYPVALYYDQTAEARRRTGRLATTRENSVAIAYSFGRTVDRLRKLTEEIATREARAREVGSASPVTTTDRLQIIGNQYASQTNELATVGLSSLEYEYRVIFSGGFAYLRSGLSTIHWAINQTAAVSRSNGTHDSKAVYSAFALLQGALEGTAIEQSSSGRAFGTASLFDYAMTLNQGGAHYLTSVAQLNAAGLSSFNDSALGGGSVAAIQSHLNSGGHVLLLANSNVGYNNLSYGGYLEIHPTYGGVASYLKGAKGGGGSTPPATSSVAASQKPPEDTKATSQDPVDLGTGAFLKDDVDLVLGNEGEPIGLRLERNYNGARRNSDPAGLGRGFTHNYIMQLAVRSPNDLDSQKVGVDEVLPLLIAIRHAQDSINFEPQAARSWLLACSSITWAVNQQLGTRASVTLGARSIEFVKRADGSYTSPGSVTATLVKNGDNSHSLGFRHGNTIRFRALDGKFDQIADRFSNTLSSTYNTQGQLATVTDARTRFFTFNYTGSKLDSVSDSTGRTVSYVQDGIGLKFTDAEGKESTCERDTFGRVSKVIDARGRTVVVNSYDVWHRVTHQHILGDLNRLNRIWVAPGLAAEVDPSGKPVWTYFDWRGRKVVVVNEAGKVARWVHDGADRLVKYTSYAGSVTEYEYNSDHNLTQEKNPTGHTRTIKYDAALRPWRVSNWEGQITQYNYTPQHRVRQITVNVTNLADPDSVENPQGIISTFEYHTAGNGRGQLAKAHPAAYEQGKFDHYTYDSWGNLDTVKRGTANASDTVPVDDYTYTARGDLTQLIDRRGVKTTYGYNKRRQRTSVTTWNGSLNAAGNVSGSYTEAGTVTTFYDDAGDVDYVLDASDRMTDTEHNALGDVAEIRQGPLDEISVPVQVVLTNVYNYRNLLEKSIVPYDGTPRTTTYTYHDTKALKSVTNPLGNSPLETGVDSHTTTFEYDDDLRRTNVTTPLGFISTTVWDSRGFKDGEDDGENPPADYTYDKDGRMKKLGNRRYAEHNKDFTWDYDDTNRKVTTKTPLLKTTVSVLNTRGLPASIQKPSDAADSPSITFDEYDAEGRLKKKTDGVGETTFTYWPNGLLKTVVEGTMTTTRTYDALNRLSEYEYEDTANAATNYTLSYTYHPSGELHTLTYPGNKTVTYTYDDFGRLYQVKDWRATNNTTTYTYSENGLLKKIERPNGTAREQSYDAAGRLRFVRESKANALFAFQELTYDDDGRMKTSFLHPMPAAITLPLDDMLFDADNRLSSFNGNTGVTYDADGNLTRGPAINGTIPASANFTYDARNRLTSHGGASYRYNPDGLRVEVTGSGAATYVVDPNAALSRTLIRTKNGVTTYYIYGLGLLYECDGAGNNAKYYHADQVGSTVALTNATGDITDRWSYAPFGTEFRVSGTSDTPFRFNGEFGVMTEVSGLVYMRARYYHPRLMRFCNADPIQFDGGLNWYAFVGNNPVSRTDPSGLWFGIDDAIFAGGGALIGVGGKLAANWVTGTPTTWQDVVGAAVGGAAGGEILLYTANPFLAGAAGGAAGNLATQGLNLATGKATEFSGTSLAVDTGVGALTGFIPGVKVQGITAGRGSAVAVFHQVVTKAGNGTISSVTTQTAGKMAVGAGMKYAVAQGAIVGSGVSNLASQVMSGNNDDYGEVVVLEPFVVTAKRK